MRKKKIKFEPWEEPHQNGNIWLFLFWGVVVGLIVVYW